MTIVVATKAKVDLQDAYDFIAKDNPQAAERVIANILEVIGLLASGAIEGRELTLRNGMNVQAWPIPPYRIYYRKRSEVFEIVRVYHQARRPIER